MQTAGVDYSPLFKQISDAKKNAAMEEYAYCMKYEMRGYVLLCV